MRILRARMLHQLGTTVVSFFGWVSNYRDTHRIAILIGKILTNQWMVGEWDHLHMCNSIGCREHVSIFGTINHMEKPYFCVSENRAPRNRLDYHHWCPIAVIPYMFSHFPRTIPVELGPSQSSTLWHTPWFSMAIPAFHWKLLMIGWWIYRSLINIIYLMIVEIARVSWLADESLDSRRFLLDPTVPLFAANMHRCWPMWLWHHKNDVIISGQ